MIVYDDSFVYGNTEASGGNVVLVTLIVVGDVARMTARTWGSDRMTPLRIGVDYHYPTLVLSSVHRHLKLSI
jgi:hypothetical protein